MKLFLFDFDGTIADTQATLIACLSQDRAARGKPPITDIAHLRTLSARAVFRELGYRFWEVPFLVRRVKPQLVQAMPSEKPFAGIKAAIAQLAKHGRVEVLTSNNQVAVEAFLKQHGIAVAVVRGDVGVFGKKAVMLRAMRDARVTKAETVYIGDELRDFEAARAAGIACALVAWGYNDPKTLKAAKSDWFLRTPKELAKLAAAR